MKATGIPLVADSPLEELPHTLVFALIYRDRINSFNELPKDKRPPRNLWDKPHRLSSFFDDMFKDGEKNKSETYMDFDPEEVE